MARHRDALVTLFCTLLAWLFTPFRQTAPLPENPRILVLKPCCLGDLLLATPALAALRARFPSATITLVTSPWSSPAVEGNPHLDNVCTWDFPATGGLPKAISCWRLAKHLRKDGFQLAVVLDRSPLVALVPWLAGIPVRAGIDSGGRGFSLTYRAPATPLRHEASLYLEVIAILGGDTADRAALFQPTAEDREWAASALEEDASWVAIHPGGGINPGSTLLGKRWPSERYAALVAQLLFQGRSVALVGGSQDTVAAAAVEEQALAQIDRRSAAGAPRGKLRSLAGTTSFGQLGALLERCQLFVGNDTGPMHLAMAVGTPTVAIFGPSMPSVYGPYDGRSKVIYHGEQCGQCVFRGGLVLHCRNAYACTVSATVEEVWKAVQAMLDGAT